MIAGTSIRAFIMAIAVAIPSGLLLWTSPAFAYTANRVWFETRPEGIYRVNVNYTVPALREFREAQVEFRSRAEAEAYYWDLVKGADFYLPETAARRFLPPSKQSPW